MKRKAGAAGTAFALGLILAACVLVLSGCKGRKGEHAEQVQPPLASRTEDQTEGLTEDMTELLTEAMTEEMAFRSIREVLDADVLSWAESFDAKEVDKLVYTILGEEKIEYEVTEPERIASFYVALMDLTVAGMADTYSQDPGDTYDFFMKDGSVIRFAFNMGCYVVGGNAYETDHSDRLWELTGQLIPPEDL